jgi:MFS family permease
MIAEPQGRARSRFSTGLASWRDTSLAPLRLRVFRALWLGVMGANFGLVMQVVAASWAMTTIDPSPDMVALVQTASTAPFVILALPSGAIADGYDRRLVMLCAQSVAFAAGVLLTMFAVAGMLTPASILIFTAVLGAASVFHQPAWQSSFTDIVPRNALVATVALSALTYNIARSLGPAIGGVVTAALGVDFVFGITALTCLGLIAVLARARFSPEPSSVPREAILPAIVAGLRFTRYSRPVQVVLLRTAVFTFGGSIFVALAPLVARDFLAGGSITYGLLLSAFGVGALIAALGAADLRARIGTERLVRTAIVLFALSTLGVGVTRAMPLSLFCTVAAGAAWTFIMTASTTCIQLNCPRWVMGRTIALYQVATLGGMALGAACWGSFAHRVGLESAFATSAGFTALSLGITWLVRLPSDTADLTPRTAVRADTATDLEPNAGPIVIAVEYHVPEESRAEFLNAMGDLRALRLRDGASRWSVRRNLDDTDRWTEQIECKGWSDVLRRLERGTMADDPIHQRAGAFRIEEIPVGRFLVHTGRRSRPPA